jgi:hypothetical protein
MGETGKHTFYNAHASYTYRRGFAEGRMFEVRSDFMATKHPLKRNPTAEKFLDNPEQAAPLHLGVRIG